MPTEAGVLNLDCIYDSGRGMSTAVFSYFRAVCPGAQ